MKNIKIILNNQLNNYLQYHFMYNSDIFMYSTTGQTSSEKSNGETVYIIKMNRAQNAGKKDKTVIGHVTAPWQSMYLACMRP